MWERERRVRERVAVGLVFLLTSVIDCVGVCIVTCKICSRNLIKLVAYKELNKKKVIHDPWRTRNDGLKWKLNLPKTWPMQSVCSLSGSSLIPP